MATVFFDRKDGTFDPRTTDQLNAAFAEINNKIKNYTTKDLAYKEEVQVLGGNSFRLGQIVCLRENYDITHELSSFTKLGEISISVPYIIWCYLCTDNNEKIYCKIKGKEIFGRCLLTKYPQKAHLCIDVVVPQRV